MSTLSSFARRLAALESQQAAPAAVDTAMADVRRQLDLIAERREAQGGYRPHGRPVVELIALARAAAV